MSEPVRSIKIGYCTGCDKQIFERVGSRLQPTDEYNEHEVELSNGTLMRVGVCGTCKPILLGNDENGRALAEYILERHKMLWEAQTEQELTRPNFHRDLAIEDHNSSPEKVRSKLIIRANAEKAKQKSIEDNAKRLRSDQKKNK